MVTVGEVVSAGMSDTNDNDTNPTSTLTAAAILAIEADASTRYGLRLKHVPNPEPALEVAKKPAATKGKTTSSGTTSSASSSSKPKGKKAKRITEATVLELIRKAGDKGVLGAEVIALWPSKEEARPYKRMLNWLEGQGRIEKVGKARAMRYRAKTESEE